MFIPTSCGSAAGSSYQHPLDNGGKELGRFLVTSQAVPAIVGCMGNMDLLIIVYEQNMPIVLVSGTRLQLKTADRTGNIFPLRNRACDEGIECSELALYTTICFDRVELSSEHSRKSRETVKHLLHGIAHDRIEHPISIEVSDYPGPIACNNPEAYATWSRSCIHIMNMGAIVRQNSLLDWESTAVLGKSDETREHRRSCTWAFLSCMALKALKQGHRHAVEDDMESMFYVLMYCSVRWLPHETMPNLGRWMHDFFHNSPRSGDGFYGGAKKDACMGSKTRFTDRVGFNNPHISTWFESAYMDLSTASERAKNHGIELTWTMDNARKLWEAACQGLPDVGEAGNDRVEHDITYCREPQRRFRLYDDLYGL